MNGLFSVLDSALCLRFSELERNALEARTVSVSSTGSIVERTNAAGFRFYSFQYYDVTGKKKERYLAGPIGSSKAEEAKARMLTQISEQTEVKSSIRMLGREGFALAESKVFATLASLHNHGVFQAGAFLVGSHAFGVLLNRIGVRAAPYATSDLDLARGGVLAFPSKPKLGLREMLQESEIEFFDVPGFDRKTPPTSYKQKGSHSFRVDLLVPSRGEDFSVLRVPELDAYAQAVPYLGYLLEGSQLSALLSRNGAVAVRVPIPERFAIHKIVVASLRRERDAKVQKDLWQAGVLSAALADLHPGAIGDAAAKLPPRARKHFRKLAPQLKKHLLPRHENAWSELDSAL